MSDAITEILDDLLATADCEVCGALCLKRHKLEGHVLCPRCTLLACGKCWKARLVLRRGRVPWRWFFVRYVCPACGDKFRWQ